MKRNVPTLKAESTNPPQTLPRQARPAAAATDPAVARVMRMVALSQGMAADASFARQLRRKFAMDGAGVE
jgi:hypothetical protein